jgi:hypothetical protein
VLLSVLIDNVYKASVSPGVYALILVHCCENCSAPLREQHKLTVVESMLLRRIFGLKKEEVAEVA